MPKEEYATVLIDEYNKTYKRDDPPLRDWYEEYLPAGLFVEDLTGEKREELIEYYSKLEEKMDERIEEKVKKEFKKYIAKLDLETFRIYLPMNLRDFEGFSDEDIMEMSAIYKDSIDNNYVEKTIRKRLRRYLKKREEEYDFSL